MPLVVCRGAPVVAAFIEAFIAMFVAATDRSV